MNGKCSCSGRFLCCCFQDSLAASFFWPHLLFSFSSPEFEVIMCICKVCIVSDCWLVSLFVSNLRRNELLDIDQRIRKNTKIKPKNWYGPANLDNNVSENVQNIRRNHEKLEGGINNEKIKTSSGDSFSPLLFVLAMTSHKYLLWKYTWGGEGATNLLNHNKRLITLCTWMTESYL